MFLSIGLFILTLFNSVLAQSIQKTGFDKIPNKFFYFKDSQVWYIYVFKGKSGLIL